MPDTLIQHVSDTAIWVAAYRAWETKRPDALFQDPFADRLVGESGHALARKMFQRGSVAWAIVIRTCLIDDFIRTLVAEGVDTILNLGAGLDSRPYRLALPPSLRWIEVDYPHVIELKEDRLRTEKPTCQLRRVKMDLSDRPARLQLFEEINASAKKVLVLTEGVVPYLSNTATAELAGDLRAMTNFQFWALDYLSPYLMKYFARGRIARRLRHAPFQFNPENWVQFFAERRWQVRDFRYMGEEAVRLKRPYPFPWLVRMLLRFAPPQRRQAMQRMSGFVLLEAKPS
jgi:methyltransferase (TIGR00027 family)